MLDSLLAALETELTSARPNLKNFQRVLDSDSHILDARTQILSSTMCRLISALEQWSEQEMGTRGAADVVVLLRQVIRATQPILVNATFWQTLRTCAELAGLFGIAQADASVSVQAQPWRAAWLPDTEHIDELTLRREPEPSPGDGMLYAMSSAAGNPWTTYQSDAQKAAVDCWTFAAPGSTTLITLPTGGGKSLCALLPPWFATRGGRHTGGTTLVVVPTVALALDQERQAQSFFRAAVGELSKPISRTGDTLPEDRRAIESALRDGRLPAIFTSPESLLGSRLYDVCLNAAREGLITRLVIDEAHLIHTWGAGFRPEFQLLASYRRRLMEASQGALQTLLLSATVGEQGRQTLEKLFAEPNKLVVIQANRLRPEIGYWFSVAKNFSERRERVLEALNYLPRPLILYITRPEDAEKWVSDLKTQGYMRVAAFTGKTDADARRQLIAQWNRNQIDLMVASSAFGLGVDKSNVRAVVHATLPENIDRFYQEVGRGGRDGFSAASLVCTVINQNISENDIGLASSLQPRLITYDKALPRWRAMIASSTRQEGLRWIDRDVTPRENITPGSEVNRDWNDHLLLLMQRAGLIQVADAPPPQEKQGEWLNRIPIRVLDPDVFNHPETALRRIEPYREEEKQSAQRDRQRLWGLLQVYSTGKAEHCLAFEFAQVYEDVRHACGGCSWCRANQIEPYSARLDVGVDMPNALRQAVTSDVIVDDALKQKLNAWRALNVTWNGGRNIKGLAEYNSFIADLVHAGIQQIIYAKELLDEPTRRDQLLADLAKPSAYKLPHLHRLIPDLWVVNNNYPLFPLATAVIYPPGDRAADELYRALQHVRAEGISFTATVNIIHSALYLKSEGKHFLQHVDGLNEPIERVQALLHAAEESIDLF